MLNFINKALDNIRQDIKRADALYRSMEASGDFSKYNEIHLALEFAYMQLKIFNGLPLTDIERVIAQNAGCIFPSPAELNHAANLYNIKTFTEEAFTLGNKTEQKAGKFIPKSPGRTFVPGFKNEVLRQKYPYSEERAKEQSKTKNKTSTSSKI